MSGRPGSIYKQAQLLLQPVEFISSPNLQKLQKETEETQATGIPSSTEPVYLNTSCRPAPAHRRPRW